MQGDREISIPFGVLTVLNDCASVKIRKSDSFNWQINYVKICHIFSTLFKIKIV